MLSLTEIEQGITKIYWCNKHVQTHWLAANIEEVSCAMFDEFGWREGWVRKGEIAKALFPHIATTTARNYLNAILQYIVLEGTKTGEPQIWSRCGKVRFTPPE